ncbi:hypothetical protein DNTS_023790 [Danionella cerebrum]|uniref:Uncharacterized protein n=1 Tax=Danionella cerebrum TaxID=2873325 RepID=A0A553QV83_9TELE|nr:hypothetical protein DNTS_023790 [Danionella translucida]
MGSLIKRTLEARPGQVTNPPQGNTHIDSKGKLDNASFVIWGETREEANSSAGRPSAAWL